MPVISSPTRSRYSSYIMSRSASRILCRITCLAVCAAIRPKSPGVTSRSSIWSRYCSNLAGSISGSSGSRISPVSGAIVVPSSIVSTIRWASRRSGMISSITRKSAVSRSISTRAYLAEPGCFLYADRSASSSATISFSGSIPFSRASACIASRISRDMCLLLHQMGSPDRRVGDGDDALGKAERDLLWARADQLAGQCVSPRERGAGLGSHAGATPDEAAEMLGLGQRALRTGRADLEAVLLAQVTERLGDALAQIERDARGVVDENPQALSGALDEQHFDVRLAAGQALLDVVL